MRRTGLVSVACGLVAAWGAMARAEAVQDACGHWVGAIEVPGSPLKIDVDLRKVAGAWEGDISIPAQGAKDVPLADLMLDGAGIAFALPGVPGNPKFSGKLAASGSTIAGEFTQGSASLPFKLERASAAAADRKAALADFGEFVRKALADWQVPGLAIGIVADGEVVYAEGFGKRDVETDLPVTSRTLFAIGSSTKAFTSLALGMQVDEGKLEWDEPVARYLPGFRLQDDYASAHITPRDLVSHRSGLPRHDLAWYNNTALTRKEMVERLPYYEPNKGLRERFQYNNMMFLTAGYLVGELDGRSWEESIQARIFAPLGMTSSNFSVNDSQKSTDFARPYELKDDVVRPMSFRNIDNVGPAGSINSNIEDLTRWILLHVDKGRIGGRNLVQEATITDMHMPHVAIPTLPNPQEPEISPASYGMGWFNQSYRGHYWVHHGGAIDGFIALVSFFPNDGIGIVALANMNGAALPGLVTRHAADRLLGLEPVDWNGKALSKWKLGKEASKEAETKKALFRKLHTKPAHALEEYAGEYEHPGYGVLKVEAGGDGLTVTFNNIVTPFEHWHYEVFSGLENPQDRTFENLRIQFLSNLKGDVDRVAVPLEPAVSEIIFTKLPDSRLSDPSYLTRFTGVYELAGQEVTVAVQGKALTLTVPGQPLYELSADRNDEFNLKGVNGFSVRFATDAQGAMTAYLNQPNGVFELKRKGS
jgi:CubicO group peptidase (beta-lactamase class C family)